MKNNSLESKLLMAVLSLGVLAYFGMQAFQYLNDPLTTALAYAYQVEEGVNVSGYVIRDEQILTDNMGGLLRIQRTEGERVSMGGTVATVYADQSSLQRQEELDALNTRVEQLRFAQEAALGVDASLKLDNQILRSLLLLRKDIVSDRMDAAEEHGSDLRALVLKRDYTYADTGNLSVQIAALEAEIRVLQSQAAGTIRRITAPAAGLFSAVVDGYESVLTPKTMRELTPSALAGIAANGAALSGIGKLILGDAWYYAAVMRMEDIQDLRESGSLSLRFAKGVEGTLPVDLFSVGMEENGRAVVLFQGDRGLPQLTLLRQQTAQVISRTIEGIRVPSGALRAHHTVVDKDTGERTVVESTGIYCIVGLEAVFKPVKVLYNGDGFALVRSTAEDEHRLLRSGEEVVVEANNLFDGKVLSSMDQLV